MDLNQINKEIKNINFSFLKYINPETKMFGNRVILFSAIIFFLSLNYLKIDELEITGIKVLIEKNILLIILIFINTYYFFQFRNSLKIDSLLAKIPNEITDIYAKIKSSRDEYVLKINLIYEEYKTFSDNLSTEKEVLIELKKKVDDIEKDEIFKASDIFVKIIDKAIKYNDRNRLLNMVFPYISFFLSTITCIVFYLIKINFKT